MPNLWKNLRKSLGESMFKKCEQLSTTRTYVRFLKIQGWISSVFHFVLRRNYTEICTGFNAQSSLFGRRFCTFST